MGECDHHWKDCPDCGRSVHRNMVCDHCGGDPWYVKPEGERPDHCPEDLLEAVEWLRKDNYLVILKAMPEGQPFRIPGNVSEYDSHYEGEDVWEGKCVASVMDMHYRKSLERRGPEPTCAAESLIEAVKLVWGELYNED